MLILIFSRFLFKTIGFLILISVRAQKTLKKKRIFRMPYIKLFILTAIWPFLDRSKNI